LPDKVTLVVKEAENAVRGDTANAASKKAWLANGFEVKVPQFIEAGEKIILSTVDGTYSGREGKTK
jgi:elongation factor P